MEKNLGLQYFNIEEVLRKKTSWGNMRFAKELIAYKELEDRKSS